MTAVLDDVTIFYGARPIAFVLMSNHFHLLIEAPLGNLSAVMNYFMRETSKKIGRTASRINHVYGARYSATLIADPIHFRTVYKYVYRNPVKAGVSASVEDYPYSTIRWLTGKDAYRFPLYQQDCAFTRKIPADPSTLLNWLNKQTPKGHDDLIRNALRRNQFAFTKDRNFQAEVERIMGES